MTLENKALKDLYIIKNLAYISHSNMQQMKHLKHSKLLLNFCGENNFFHNICRYLDK